MTDSHGREVALTGATGFIGQYLLEDLSTAGWQVRPISRSGGPGMFECGDLATSRPDWPELLAGVDTVIHGAAIAHQPLDDSPSGRAQRERLYRVNRDAVADLAEGCVAVGVRRLIFLSTVKVYGESTSPGAPFKETDALNPEDDYGRSKQQAEELLRSFPNRGLEVCSLRLPLVYGPRPKANFLRLQRLAVSGWPLPLGSIENRRSLLGLNNLSLVIDALLRMQVWPHAELNVADPLPVSTPELIRGLGVASGKSPLLLPFPVSLMRALASIMGREGDVERVTGNLEVSVDRLQGAVKVPLVSTAESLKALHAQDGPNRRAGEVMG